MFVWKRWTWGKKPYGVEVDNSHTSSAEFVGPIPLEGADNSLTREETFHFPQLKINKINFLVHLASTSSYRLGLTPHSHAFLPLCKQKQNCWPTELRVPFVDAVNNMLCFSLFPLIFLSLSVLLSSAVDLMRGPWLHGRETVS